MTAKAALDSRLEGIRRGADSYLTKPFSPQELALRIRKLIEMRQLLYKRYENGQSAPTNEESLPKSVHDMVEQEDAFIRELRALILDHIDDEQLNGDMISKHFSLSRMQIHRKLKALTNCSLTKFIRTIRLQRAYELVKDSRYNISEAAYATGFNSLSHFSRAFKKQFGKTPSEIAQK